MFVLRSRLCFPPKNAEQLFQGHNRADESMVLWRQYSESQNDSNAKDQVLINESNAVLSYDQNESGELSDKDMEKKSGRKQNKSFRPTHQHEQQVENKQVESTIDHISCLVSKYMFMTGC